MPTTNCTSSNAPDTSLSTCSNNGQFKADQKKSIVQPAKRPKMQVNLDLVATVDRTGSSKQFQMGIPLAFEIILKQLEAKARKVKVSLWTHGDLDFGEQTILHTDQGTPEQAINDIRGISYGGGMDAAETHLCSIKKIFNESPWSLDPVRSRGAILAFMTDDTKPTRSGITAKELGKQIKDKGILLYLVCQPTPTFQELVAEACGLIFPISNNPDPKDLQKIASQLAASILVSASSGTMPVGA